MDLSSPTFWALLAYAFGVVIGRWTGRREAEYRAKRDAGSREGKTFRRYFLGLCPDYREVSEEEFKAFVLSQKDGGYKIEGYGGYRVEGTNSGINL